MKSPHKKKKRRANQRKQLLQNARLAHLAFDRYRSESGHLRLVNTRTGLFLRADLEPMWVKWSDVRRLLEEIAGQAAALARSAPAETTQSESCRHDASIERIYETTLKALFVFLGPSITTRIEAEAEILRLRAAALDAAENKSDPRTKK